VVVTENYLGVEGLIILASKVLINHSPGVHLQSFSVRITTSIWGNTTCDLL